MRIPPPRGGLFSFAEADPDADRRRIRAAGKLEAGGFSPESIYTEARLFRDFETNEWMRPHPAGAVSLARPRCRKLRRGRRPWGMFTPRPPCIAEFPELKKAPVRFVPWYMLFTDGMISYDGDGKPTIWVDRNKIKNARLSDKDKYQREVAESRDFHIKHLRSAEEKAGQPLRFGTNYWDGGAQEEYRIRRDKMPGKGDYKSDLGWADMGWDNWMAKLARGQGYYQGDRMKAANSVRGILEHEIQHFIDQKEGRSASAPREELVSFGEIAKGAEFWREAADKAGLSADSARTAALRKLAERTLAGEFKDEDAVFAALGEIFSEAEMVKLRGAAMSLAYEKSVGEVRARQAENWKPGAPPPMPADSEDLIPNLNAMRGAGVFYGGVPTVGGGN